MTEEFAWAVFNFIWDWKSGKFGEVTLQEALDAHFPPPRT